MAKLTFEEIEKRMAELHPTIELMQDFYINAHTKMKCRCKVCENLFESCWNNLQQKRSCPVCSKRRGAEKVSLTIEIVRERTAILNPTIKIISEYYKNDETPLECECLVDGKLFTTSWSRIQKGGGCPECRYRKVSEKLRLPFDEVKERIESITPDILVLSTEYKNRKSKLTCRCLKYDYIFEMTAGDLLDGHKCPRCSRESRAANKTLSYEDVVSEVAVSLPNVKILSAEYIKTTEDLKCECLIDGTIFYQPYARLRLGVGCPTCTTRNISGENSWNWKGGKSAVTKYLRSSASKWKKDSMRKSSYRCVITGNKFDHVHHLYGFDIITEEIFELTKLPIYSNMGDYNEEELMQLKNASILLHDKHGLGCCVTAEIHKEFHGYYGWGQNTPEQWANFLEIKKMEKTNDIN